MGLYVGGQVEDYSKYLAQIKGKEPIPGNVFIEGEPVFYVFEFPATWKSLKIIPISDAHYGNHLFSEHHFIRTVKAINTDPCAFTILNGDLCECVTRSSLGDIYKQTVSPQAQRDWIIKRLDPIKKRILGMTMGNHEERIYKDAGIDICADIAEALRIPYRPEGITVRVIFGKGNDGHEGRPYTYDIYATHGFGGARTKGGKAAKLERTGHYIHADAYLMSHDHDVNVAPDTYLIPTTSGKDVGERWKVGKFQAHRKMLIKTNAYLKWGGYSEKKGFSPTDLETPIITLAGQGKPKVSVTV